MNSRWKHAWQFACLFFAVMPWHHSYGQNSNISFEDTRFDKVLQMLERANELTINYESSSVQEFIFSGDLDMAKPEESLAILLYDSPFHFEQHDHTVLIYRTAPVSYSLCGTIRDELSQDPLVGATVVIQHTNQGSQTDNNGFFEIEVTAVKNQRLDISYIGFKKVSFQLQELAADDCADILLQIDKELWGEEIIVRDYLLAGISAGQTYGGYELNYGQLAKQNSVVEHDVLKTAQLLPGIFSLDESATNLQIRGSTADQNLILWEGATIYQPAHLFGMISALNPFAVQDVNIYKGAYDPSYDNRVGGIIDISMSDSIKSGPHGSAGFTLTEAHLNMELPIISQKLGVSFAGRQSINSIYNSPPLTNYRNKVFQLSKIDDQSQDAQEGTLNADQKLNFYDWNAQVVYRPSDRLYVNASLYRNNQNFEYTLSFPEDPFNTLDKIESQSDALSTRMEWDADEHWKLSLAYIQSTYNSQHNYQEEESGAILADYVQLNDITDQSLSASSRYSNDVVSFSAGYDFNVKAVNYSLINDNIFEPVFEDVNSEQAIFHSLFSSINLGSRSFSLNGGIRASHYIEQSKWFLSPRLSVQYSVSSALKLKAEGGIFHQFVSQLSDFGSRSLQIDNTLWVLNTSTDDLSQQAKKMAVGFIYQGGGWLADVELYYNQTSGLNSSSPGISLAEIINFSRGRSTAVGLDVLLKKRWGDFNTWVNYSLGKNKFFFPEISSKSFAARNDVRHVLSLVSSYQIRDVQLAMISSYHSGLPYSLPASVISSFDEVDEELNYRIDYQDLNNARLKHYARLDLSVTYRSSLLKVKGLDLEFSLSVLNLLQRENDFKREYFLDLESNAEEPRLAFVNRSLLQRTPLLMMRIYW